MTDSRFSSKFESARVLSVCLVFIVAVSLLYGFVIYKNNYEIRIKDIFLIIFILFGVAAVWISRRMARPLRALSHVMARVGEGDLTSGFQKDRMGFEINALGSQFNQMLDAFAHHMESAEKGTGCQRII